MTEKSYTDRAVQTQIINHLINRLNEMLQEIANADSRVHHLDLRETLNDDDWANELHLKNSTDRRVANQFDDLIRGL
jgi:hypothetical protein